MRQRLLVVGLSLASISVLLLHLYGLIPMWVGALVLCAPSSLALGVLFWQLPAGELKDDIRLGLMGGLLGTIGYDLFRVPFAVFGGYRLFTSIRGFGVWLLDSPYLTVWTEIAGWTYHLSNGLTLGIVYAVLVRRRHWGWGVVWGLLIECVAVFSPFGSQFNLLGNPVVLSIAYAGHVAYGAPLGLICLYREATLSWWRALEPPLRWGALGLLLLLLFQPLLNPTLRSRFSEPANSGVVQIKELYLLPEWSRFRGALTLKNPATHEIEIAVGKEVVTVPPTSQITLNLEPGIHQLRRSRQGRTVSSFAEVLP